MRFGIICAMPEEIKELTAKLSDKQEKEIGGKSYLFGKISNQDVVLVESGIGKVEAGITMSPTCKPSPIPPADPELITTSASQSVIKCSVVIPASTLLIPDSTNTTS